MAFFVTYIIFVIAAIAVGSARGIRSMGLLVVLTLLLPIVGLIYAFCGDRNRIPGEELLNDRERRALRQVQADTLRAKAREVLEAEDAVDAARRERDAQDRINAARSRRPKIYDGEYDPRTR